MFLLIPSTPLENASRVSDFSDNSSNANIISLSFWSLKKLKSEVLNIPTVF